MRNVLTIAWLDLTVYLRDRGNLISLVFLPVLLTVVIGAASGGSGGGGPTQIRIDLLDNDNSAASQQFVADLRAMNDALLICPQDQNEDNACNLEQGQTLDVDSAIARVSSDVTSALLVIPQGYSASLDSLQPLDLPYYSAADLISGDPVQQSVQAVLQRVNGAVVAARVGAGLRDTLVDSAADDPAFATDVYDRASQLWDSPPATIRYTQTIASEQDDASPSITGFSQSVPGMATFFVVFSVLGGGMIMLIRERRQGTLPRMATMPLRRGEILAGKILSRFVIGMIQFLIVFAVGVVVGVDFGNSPVALIALMVAYTLTITALGLALGAFVTNEGQADSLTTLSAMVMAALGGAWWPLSIAPPFMQVVGHLTPVGWAMDGFQTLFFFGGGLGDVLLPIGVLLAATAVLFIIGIRSFRYA